jgi:hypothetical protein
MSIEERLRLIELTIINLARFVNFDDLPEEVRNYIELIENELA